MKPGAPGGAFGPGAGGSAGSGDGVTALVEALATNTTDTARQALQDVIAGKVKTEVEDATVTKSALVAIADSMSGKHGETLFQALTKPDQLRSGQGSVTAESLQQAAIQAVESKDLPALRGRMAQQIAAVAAAFRKPLIEMLLQQRSDNVRAQIDLYAANVVDDAGKRKLQSAFAGYGREVLNQVMGVSEEAVTGRGTGPGAGAIGAPGAGAAPAGGAPMGPPGGKAPGAGAAPPGGKAPGQGAGPPGGAPGAPPGAPRPGAPGAGGQPGAAAGPAGGAPGAGAPGGAIGGGSRSNISVDLKPEQVDELVAGLWTSQFAGEVAKSVSGAKPDADAIRLGASMPLSPVRRSFQQLVDRHGKGGPETLIQNDTLADVVRDPGLLLVLKTVPWKNRPKSALPDNSSGVGGANPGGAPGQPGAANAGAGKGEKKTKVDNRGDGSEKWLDATELVVRSLFARLGAANRKASAPSPPIKTPRGEVSAEYYLKWPDELPAGAKQLGVAPMVVHYLRMETNDRGAGTSLAAQVRNHRTHAIPGGFWYENRLSQKGKLTSLDVMVSQAGAAAGSSGPGGAKPGGFPGAAAPGGAPGAAPGGLPGGAPGAGSGRSKTTSSSSEGVVIELLYVEIPDYQSN